jgi:hypothetical protein
MRSVWKGLLAVSLLVGTAQVTFAGCTDETAVKNARMTAEEQCTMEGNGCLTAATHGAYVSCIGAKAKALVGTNPGDLPKNCTGKVKKCAAKSMCGQDKVNNGFVVCCVPSKKGPKCKITKADKCTAKSGTGPLTSGNGSCCSETHPLTADACNASPSGAFLE